MIYVQNHKLQSGKEVGKWHKFSARSKDPVTKAPRTDCGRHVLDTAKDKTNLTKPRNLTPVNSCGTCFGPKDWIR